MTTQSTNEVTHLNSVQNNESGDSLKENAKQVRSNIPVPGKLLKVFETFSIDVKTTAKAFAAKCGFFPVYNAVHQDRVPQKVENFFFDPLVMVPLLAAYRASIPTMLVGPQGSGKTDYPKQLAARINQEVTHIEATPETSIDQLIGFSGLKDGSIKTIKGKCAKAFENGDLLIIDEVCSLKPEVLIGLHSLMEPSTKQLVIPAVDNEAKDVILKRHPAFRIVLTSNTGGTEIKKNFKATGIMSDAILSRICRIDVDYLSEEIEIPLLLKRAEGISPTMAQSMVKIANHVRESYKEGQCSSTICFRSLMKWASLYNLLGDVDLAFRMTIFNHFKNDAKARAKLAYGSHISALKLTPQELKFLKD